MSKERTKKIITVDHPGKKDTYLNSEIDTS